MEAVDRALIRSNYVLLVDELPTREVLGHFLVAGLFTMRDAQEILELPPSKRNGEILSLLLRRGPRAMVCLTTALLHAERYDLIQRLYPAKEATAE